MKIALIDLGSNSARMYLTEVTETGEVRYLKKERVMTRLSEGMGGDKRLQPLPMERTCNVLRTFSEKIRESGAMPLAVATAAVRKAENGGDFCRRVFRETGLNLYVISGQQEAFFDFQGVLFGLKAVDNCLIFDTGGGSTELILVKNRTLREKISLPFGAMSLTDHYLRKNPGWEGVKAVAAAVEEQLRKAAFLEEATGFPLIGLGGSAAVLAGLDQRLLTGSLREIDPQGYSLTGERMEVIFRELQRRTPKERVEELGLEPGRADTVCAGILPGCLLMKRLSAPRMQICTTGLREGILAMLIREGLSESMSDTAAFLRKFA